MKVHEVEPDIDTGALLAGAQFIDAYSIAIDNAALDARRAAEKMLARGPRWIDVLLALRNYLVLTHNLLGRTYLAIILPSHRLVVRAMLRQVAA
jgi:hypothetical protein